MIQILAELLPPGQSAERIRTVEAALRSDAGPFLREQIGSSLPALLPVEVLVPKIYAQWRPLVRDAMAFLVSRLSDARLAPKLVEQLDLPPDTSPEIRLLRLIAKMPGLQKLGQVLARNRHLHPLLRDALSELENEISDVTPDEIRAVIDRELGPQLATYTVEIEPAVFSEASVSAVVRFTWRNPSSGVRERGVFKVMKPHVPAFFAEDMDLLRQLADFAEPKHRDYGFAANVLPDTFNEVRLLLEHEVDFAREQRTLGEASRLYRSGVAVRVPHLIPRLCASNITAISEEQGVKVTDAASRMSVTQRKRVAEQLIEALIAVPLFAAEGHAMFHADPHAGNLLYDERAGELVILDWALTERLTPEQQRQLAMLFVMLTLRDPAGISRQIQALQNGALQNGAASRNGADAQLISDCVTAFIGQLPLVRLPNSMDAMRLLDRVAFAGVQFPAPLIMWRKALFTLEGILHEIAGENVSIDAVLVGHAVQSWIANCAFRPPLLLTDWIGMQWSALFYGNRVWTQWASAVCAPILES